MTFAARSRRAVLGWRLRRARTLRGLYDRQRRSKTNDAQFELENNRRAEFVARKTDISYWESGVPDNLAASSAPDIRFCVLRDELESLHCVGRRKSQTVVALSQNDMFVALERANLETPNSASSTRSVSTAKTYIVTECITRGLLTTDYILRRVMPTTDRRQL